MTRIQQGGRKRWKIEPDAVADPFAAAVAVSAADSLRDQIGNRQSQQIESAKRPSLTGIALRLSCFAVLFWTTPTIVFSTWFCGPGMIGPAHLKQEVQLDVSITESSTPTAKYVQVSTSFQIFKHWIHFGHSSISYIT